MPFIQTSYRRSKPIKYTGASYFPGVALGDVVADDIKEPTEQEHKTDSPKDSNNFFQRAYKRLIALFINLQD